MVSLVFKVEVAAINEGLQWLSSLLYHNVEVESDSLLSVQALKRPYDNCLELVFFWMIVVLFFNQERDCQFLLLEGK